MVFTPSNKLHQQYAAAVRADLIDEAKAALSAAAERVKASTGDLATAAAAHEAAKVTSSDAIAGKGELSPMDAEEVLEIAERRHRVATKINGAAEAARAEAEAAVETVRGAAHEPAYRLGMVMRFQACIAAEAARKALDEAQQAYDASAWVMNGAVANGAMRFFGGEPSHRAGQDALPVADEARLWRGRVVSASGLTWDGDGDLKALIEEARNSK